MAATRIQKLDFEVEILKLSADKFYGLVAKDVKEITKLCPHLCQSIEVLEGDGGVGTVQAWKIILGGILYVKEIVAARDDEKRVITHHFIEGDIMKDYTRFEKTLVVTPNGTGDDDENLGSLVKWTIIFEKANEDVPAPAAFKDFMISLTKDLDAHHHA